MKTLLLTTCSGIALLAAHAGGDGKVLTPDLPLPVRIGTPKPLSLYTGKAPRLDLASTNAPPALIVPAGSQVISLGRPVTSSDPYPVIGSLEMITDGDKEGTDGSFVELGPDLQWVQIDLGYAARIDAVVVWHRPVQEPKHLVLGVVAQVSDDPDFITGVTTLFNNDDDNSSGLGAGKDLPYFESQYGKRIPGYGVRARYVRCHSRGNAEGDLNHHTEVEVWGAR